MIFKDPQLPTLWQRIQEGRRLSLEDGRALFASPDLLGVGWMADQVRRRRHGNRATYTRDTDADLIEAFLRGAGFVKGGGHALVAVA